LAAADDGSRPGEVYPLLLYIKFDSHVTPRSPIQKPTGKPRHPFKENPQISLKLLFIAGMADTHPPTAAATNVEADLEAEDSAFEDNESQTSDRASIVSDIMKYR
jgi:hypothetical protein